MRPTYIDKGADDAVVLQPTPEGDQDFAVRMLQYYLLLEMFLAVCFIVGVIGHMTRDRSADIDDCITRSELYRDWNPYAPVGSYDGAFTDKGCFVG